MYCPQCRTEYRVGFTRCADCDVTLVEHLGPDAQDVELAKVFETAEPSLIPVVESVLRNAGIEFLVKNQRLHSTVPGADFAVGPVEYWVAREQAENTKALLQELATSSQ
jgi:hypothetical protein